MSDTPVSPLESRRAEVAQYDANIAMYTQILSTLPKVWPAHLEHLRDATNEHEAAASVEDINDVVLLSQLLYADRCKAAIRTETLERTKAASILAVLESQAANP